MNLFQRVDLILHSGGRSDFKIECDALTDEDINTLAYLIYKKYKPILEVYGVPEGGLRLQKALLNYISNDVTGNILIVDDVLTTGNSMEELKSTFEYFSANAGLECKGVVIFARGKCPEWVEPIFQMWEN